MTTLTHRPAGSALMQAAASATRALVAGWRARAGHRHVLDLNALDDHALRDLGLHRSELASLAAELDGRAEITRLHVVYAGDR